MRSISNISEKTGVYRAWTLALWSPLPPPAVLQALLRRVDPLVEAPSPSVAPLFCPFGPFILFYSGLLFYFILAHSSLATNSLSCGAGSIFLTNPHGPGKMCTEDLEPGGRGSIQLPVKGLHRWAEVTASWERTTLLYPRAWISSRNRVLGNHLLHLSARHSVKPFMWEPPCWLWPPAHLPPRRSATWPAPSRSLGEGSPHPNPQQRSKSWPHSLCNEV